MDRAEAGVDAVDRVERVNDLLRDGHPLEPIPTDRTVVLYDRDCGFCRWSLSKLLAWDRRGRLWPVAIQDPEAEQLLAGMGEEERMASWHLVTPDGEVRSAGAAFEPLLRSLPGGRPLAVLAERAPHLVGHGYRWVAGHRTPFGRRLTAGAKRRADRRIAAREAS